MREKNPSREAERGSANLAQAKPHHKYTMLITIRHPLLRTLEVQDLATFNLVTDLMIDLNVYAIQNSHNSIILENSRDATAALLYIAGRKDVVIVKAE